MIGIYGEDIIILKLFQKLTVLGGDNMYAADSSSILKVKGPGEKEVRKQGASQLLGRFIKCS